MILAKRYHLAHFYASHAQCQFATVQDLSTPMSVDEAPTKKTKHTSKGKKGNAPVSVQAAQRDNNNQDTTVAVAAAIQPTLALIDPTNSSNAINVPVSTTTTTTTTNVPTTVETCDGAAGDTHPVSPNAGSKDWVTPDQGTLRFLDNISCSINLKASDTVTHSPPPLSQLELEGASRTHGGILRGCALGNRPNLADMDTTMDTNIPYLSKIHLYITSSTNPADWALQSMSRQVLKHPVTTSLEVILQHIFKRHSPVQSKSSQIQISCISFLLIRA